ncbi:MAG: hypothetical protein ACRYE9_03610 [Janthinobacterium lividum]
MKLKLIFSFIALLIVLIGGLSIRNNSPIVPDEELLKDVTVLTSSYDGYSELWRPHYELLFKNWPSLKEEHDFIPVMLITNELKYEDSRVMSLSVGTDTTWSKNLLKALESVKTKYTFLLFDDYIISTPVDEKRFIELLTLLEETSGAYIEVIIDEGQFSYGHEKHKKFVTGIESVIYRSKGSACRNSLQASIWNTEELRKLIDPKESA